MGYLIYFYFIFVRTEFKRRDRFHSNREHLILAFPAGSFITTESFLVDFASRAESLPFQPNDVKICEIGIQMFKIDVAMVVIKLVETNL